jgi:lysophospholipase L1-like esterase
MLKKNDTILFIGDSITDCSRERPAGADKSAGSGYVSLIKADLLASFPEKNLSVINTGISGNRVIDLKYRWNDDVKKHNPSVLSVMIGINDVWRQFDQPDLIPQMTPEEYTKLYTELLNNIPDSADRLILATPYLIETNKDDPMRSMMDTYTDIVKDFAEKYNAVLIDTQQAFDTYLKSQNADTLAEDCIHPNLTGHMVIAKSFLEKLTGN